MNDFILKVAALSSAVAIGLYACKLWEKSLRFQQHKLYIESAVRMVEAIMKKGEEGRNDFGKRVRL